MPLCPQYSWEESEKALTVVLTAPGLSKAKTDLLISDLQVRISCQPYLLQLDLRHEVDEARCSATFGASQLSLRLSKVRHFRYRAIDTFKVSNEPSTGCGRHMGRADCTRR